MSLYDTLMNYVPAGGKERFKKMEVVIIKRCTPR